MSTTTTQAPQAEVTPQRQERQRTLHQAVLSEGCDQCGHHVRAFVAALIASKSSKDGLGILAFCKHHYEVHEERLAPITLDLIDNRSVLTQQD